RRPDPIVDLYWRQSAHLGRSASVAKKLARGRLGHLVARANRDDAGDELFKWGLEALVGQREQRRLRIGTHGPPDAAHHLVDVKRLVGTLRAHTRLLPSNANPRSPRGSRRPRPPLPAGTTGPRGSCGASGSGRTSRARTPLPAPSPRSRADRRRGEGRSRA